MCFQNYVKDGDFERAFPSYCKPLQRHTELLDSEDYEAGVRGFERAFLFNSLTDAKNVFVVGPSLGWLLAAPLSIRAQCFQVEAWLYV
jgi:hypothetical protein